VKTYAVWRLRWLQTKRLSEVLAGQLQAARPALGERSADLNGRQQDRQQYLDRWLVRWK